LPLALGYVSSKHVTHRIKEPLQQVHLPISSVASH
jgi:hypothetical protein